MEMKEMKMKECRNEELRLRNRWRVDAVVTAFLVFESWCYDRFSVANTLIFYV